MKAYRPEQVINGTWGECWVDGNYFAEVTGLEATVTLEKQEINQPRVMAKGYKVTGYDCKGTIKFNKVSSFAINLMNENMKKRKQTIVTIISKLDDPDSLGAERVIIKDATFDELKLVNWEAKKNTEESMAFTFNDWELLDTIPDN